MQNVSDIVSAFGGPTAFGKLLGAPYRTVKTWERRNYLPADRDVDLVEQAKALGIDLSFETLARIRHAAK
tara:strand:+ start:235 stop:444 length:210 start_codon:yes stop_codon:yes gene_type:complete